MLIRFMTKTDSTAMRTLDFGATYLIARMITSDMAAQALLTGVGAFFSEEYGARVKQTNDRAPRSMSFFNWFGTPE